MRKNRFYVSENIEDTDVITLTDRELLHQIKKVLRLRLGDEVVLFNGDGYEFHGKISSITNSELNISKKEIKFLLKSSKEKLKLVFAILKKDKFQYSAIASKTPGIAPPDCSD